MANDIEGRLNRVAEGRFDDMSFDLLREAADEIERLRAENEQLQQQVQLSHAILGSEAMIWLAAGSNHTESQLEMIRPAIKKYWDEHGNVFRPKDEEAHGEGTG